MPTTIIDQKLGTIGDVSIVESAGKISLSISAGIDLGDLLTSEAAKVSSSFVKDALLAAAAALKGLPA